MIGSPHPLQKPWWLPIKCDRCGDTASRTHGMNGSAKPTGWTLATLQTKPPRGGPVKTNRVDLCPKCTDELADFINVLQEVAAK